MTTTSDSIPAPPSKAALWTGRVLSALVVAFMLMGVYMNLSGSPQAVEGLQKMGYPAEAGTGIAIALLVSVIAFAVPQTSVLGAILLTGYLGGAVATHIRAAEGWGTTVPALVFAAITWASLLLRNRQLREVLPLTKN